MENYTLVFCVYWNRERQKEGERERERERERESGIFLSLKVDAYEINMWVNFVGH